MQRVMQRAQRARRQSEKKATALKEHIQNTAEDNWRKRVRQVERNARSNVKAARKALKQDWEMGPLAPRRDFAKEPGAYGALSAHAFQKPPAPKHIQPNLRPKAHMFVGDRAVVYKKGPDYGKIGKITRINEEGTTAELDCLSKINVAVEPEQRVEESMNRPYITYPGQISLNELGLVARIGGEDVIVEKTFYNKKAHIRKIYKTSINVPLPPKAAEDPEGLEHDDDTLRIDVDEQTYMPYLLTSPFPEGVIDELRNKYSRLRIRHDADYIEKKKAEDEAAETNAVYGEVSMRSPLQELRAQKKKEAETRPPRQLPEEVMQRMALALKEIKQQKKTGKHVRIASNSALPPVPEHKSPEVTL